MGADLAPSIVDSKPVTGVPHFHHEFSSMSLGDSEATSEEQDPAVWNFSQPAEISEELLR